jgi:ABC-type lipoprotein release transport system permease subunit
MHYTDKKENKKILHILGILNGAVAKSYITNGLLIRVQ